jgi:hypothetical protein
MDNFTKIECYKCGVIWAVSERYNNHRLEDKGSFYCPNGHSQAYVKSTSDTLKEKLEQKDREIGWKINKINTLEVEKAKLERKLKRGITKHNK